MRTAIVYITIPIRFIIGSVGLIIVGCYHLIYLTILAVCYPNSITRGKVLDRDFFRILQWIVFGETLVVRERRINREKAAAVAQANWERICKEEGVAIGGTPGGGLLGAILDGKFNRK